MLFFEYLALKITGSKGVVNSGYEGKSSWDNARLVITQNGITTKKNLIGGLEKIEEHLDNQLACYGERGWKPFKIERTEEKSQSDSQKNITIHCILKRSVELEPSENSTKIPQLALKGKEKPQHLQGSVRRWSSDVSSWQKSRLNTYAT